MWRRGKSHYGYHSWHYCSLWWSEGKLGDLYGSSRVLLRSKRDRDRRTETVLTVCGPTAYEVLRNLAQPAQLKDKSYSDLVALMKKHLDPTSLCIMYRYTLFTAIRKPGESIATYVSHLQAIAAYEEGSLKEMLQDAFVFGINDPQIQRRLFQEKADASFTLEKAVELATTIELSSKDSLRLNTQQPSSVHRIFKQP